MAWEAAARSDCGVAAQGWLLRRDGAARRGGLRFFERVSHGQTAAPFAGFAHHPGSDRNAGADRADAAAAGRDGGRRIDHAGKSARDSLPARETIGGKVADANSPTTSTQNSSSGWLNRTVLGVGVTCLFSDWSHEIATAILPAFLATIGAGPAWLGAIEGISDGLSSFAKLGSGHYTDRLKKRKPLAVFGYAFTALATASFAFATQAYQVLFGRAAAWLGRGVRSPVKKALLAADVPAGAYGRAFGLERLMDTVGAIAGPLTALWLLQATHHNYRAVFLWTLLPGMIAVLSFWLLVRERPF